MKIIFLNTWNGRLKIPFFEFINKHKKDTDLFCFQEVEKELFNELTKKLDNFNTIRAVKNYLNDWTFNLATFIKKDIEIKLRQITSINKKIGEYLITEILINGNRLIVCNVHGVSMPGDKLDTKERLLQSSEIIKKVKKYNTSAIIGGDFNLDKNSESNKLFKENGFKDLISDFKIKSTRNRIAWEYHKEGKFGYFGKQKYSDYCYLSKDIQVNSFKVSNFEISDHLPLILEFDM